MSSMTDDETRDFIASMRDRYAVDRPDMTAYEAARWYTFVYREYRVAFYSRVDPVTHGDWVQNGMALPFEEAEKMERAAYADLHAAVQRDIAPEMRTQAVNDFAFGAWRA